MAGTSAKLVVGPGDDAAGWIAGAGTALVSTDTLVEGVDFERDLQSPYEVGAKAWGSAASDLAAMGAEVEFGLVAAVLPRGLFLETVEAIQLGLVEAAARDGATLAGGDLSAAPGPLVLTVTVVGSVPDGQPVTISGGRDGDVLVLTGELGAAAAALESWRLGDGAVPPEWRARLVTPRARIPEGRALRQAGVTAMTDLSDGLLLDAGRLAAASGIGVELWADHLPVAAGIGARWGAQALRLAVAGGEDYELLASLPERAFEGLADAWPPQLAPLHLVGRMVRGAGVRLLEGRAGAELTMGGPLGFQHY
ncbi:MAG: thiamine-phosphate kinase [Candidatus Dormibacteria bacterium]